MQFWSRRGHRRLRVEMAAEKAKRQTEEALARLNALFLNSPDAMVISRVIGQDCFICEAANPAWETMVGVSAAYAVGRSPRDYLPADILEPVLRSYRQCAVTGGVVHARFKIGLPHNYCEWATSVSAVLNEAGTVERLVVVGKDMTDWIKLEDAQRQQQRLEAVKQLTAGIAQDFNNLLQVVLGSLEVLGEQDGLDVDGRLCVQLASSAGDRGAKLVAHLVAFSSKQLLEPIPLSADKILTNIQPRLVQSVGSSIAIEVQIGEALPTILADAAQLEDCLINLVQNAREAMRSGGVLRVAVNNATSRAIVDAGLPTGEYVVYSIQDEGTGMPPDILGRATEPFFSTKTTGRGSGLGLSAALGFARQSGGDIRIKSRPGQGTTVSLWLPAASIPPETVLALSQLRTSSGDSRGRVLLVEDEATVGATLSLFLRHAGYEPILAENGETALYLLRSDETFDLLITDQTMPDMSGSDVIAAAVNLRPALPTLLITGHDQVDGIQALRGRLTVLIKPFSREVFLRQVYALSGSGPTKVHDDLLEEEPADQRHGAAPTNVVSLPIDPAW